jgi:hypothetical protein
MAMGNGGPASFAARRSPSQPGHLRGCRVREPRVSLTIDEDQLLWIEVELAVEPGYAAAQDIGTLLL